MQLSVDHVSIGVHTRSECGLGVQASRRKDQTVGFRLLSVLLQYPTATSLDLIRLHHQHDNTEARPLAVQVSRTMDR
jgi:hypothetical protein